MIVNDPFLGHDDLAADDLLEKCLHGKTQNANEAVNNCIWRKAPKDIFLARRTLEVSVASAIVNYNDGSIGILKVMEECGFSPGHYTVVGSAESNKARVKAMNRKSSDKCKSIRKKKRAVRKGYTDKDNLNKETYAYGGF